MERPPPAPPQPILARPLVRGVVAAAIVGALAVAAVALRAGGDGDGGDGAVVPAASASVRPSDGLGPLDGRAPLKGAPAPDFALRTTSGEVVRLGDLRGKVVLVNFWASWCEPCKRELPVLQRIYDEKRAEGLEVLAVNVEDNAETARSYFASRDLTMPVLLDSDGEVFEQYRLQGLPDSFFIDRDGNVGAMWFGELNETRTRDKLSEAGLP